MLKIATPLLLTDGHDLCVQLLQLQLSACPAGPAGRVGAARAPDRSRRRWQSGLEAGPRDDPHGHTGRGSSCRAVSGPKAALDGQSNQSNHIITWPTHSQPANQPPGTPASRPEKALCGQRYFFPPLCPEALCPISR